MKKLFAFISVLALMSAALFADVSAKKNADGSVAVTFFYGNPRATEVLLAGDFTNWQDGALPMEKGEKGFSITVNFKAGDEGRYKFISDGNWTTDLRAPDFVDDGFGGKNSHIVIADLLGGDEGDSGAAKAKINFVSWTMIGVQGNYITNNKNHLTQTTSISNDGLLISRGDKTYKDENTKSSLKFTQNESKNIAKGMDLDSVTFGMKSYNKFVGNFLPNCPLYIEIALAETEMEDYAGNKSDVLQYLYRQDPYGNDAVEFEEGIKKFFSGWVAAPVEYAANAANNKSGTSFGAIPGPGSNPFLGHLKFGFNTPYINFVTGFNYAKPAFRDAITWKTVTGNWDAGYHHVGGFNVFSLGDKSVAFLEEKTGWTFDIGFAPNKTGDRKGTKYGYWGWAGAKKDNLVIDFQTNGMYNGNYIFYEPVEHDFILGAKDEIELNAGKLSFAAQGLLATHQASSEKIADWNAADNGVTAANGSNIDYFGYSTDVLYRSGDFDGIKNMAGNVRVGFKGENFAVNGEYRFRGAQASMLYVRENHDDATFDLSDQLGVLNEQRVAVDATFAPIEGLSLGLNTQIKMPLEKLTTKTKVGITKDADGLPVLGNVAVDPVAYNYSNNSREGRPAWYDGRFDDNRALYDINGGACFTFKPSASYEFKDLGLSLNAYTKMNYRNYDFDEETVYDPLTKKMVKKTVGNYLVSDNDYGSTESKFRVATVGLSATKKIDSDVLKSVDVYYGLDNTNGARLFNTLVGQVKFAKNITATVAFGLKTINDNDAAKNAGYKDKVEYTYSTEERWYGTEKTGVTGVNVTKGNTALNNPFAFAVGVSKQFDKLKKPTVYAQFVYNTDPFKHFGDGQDQLNLSGANVNGSVEKENAGNIDAVDWYDGRAAWRIGIRWDI